ncbi:thioesterase domain-containing protein [Actinocorallia sp. B10E7]|uniref:thioesterase II family protein n=1 Tax=Actinocorallia sp. B10E7 TaxID=3153558 RepID=UPI00325D1CF7
MDSLIEIRPVPSPRITLVCLPFAGGGTSAFHDWPRDLPGDVAIWAARPPGRESRLFEPAHRGAEAVVADLLPPLIPLTRGPYVVFGHSMGALLGYELVRALRARRLPEPAHLVVSGHEAPHLGSHRGDLHRLPDELLIAKLRHYGATPPELLDEPELLEHFLPSIRADFAVVETYEHAAGPPLGCPVTAFRGEADQDVTAEGCLAWAGLTLGGFRSAALPGGHFYDETGRRALLAGLRSLLTDGVPARA